MGHLTWQKRFRNRNLPKQCRKVGEIKKTFLGEGTVSSTTSTPYFLGTLCSLWKRKLGNKLTPWFKLKRFIFFLRHLINVAWRFSFQMFDASLKHFVLITITLLLLNYILYLRRKPTKSFGDNTNNGPIYLYFTHQKPEVWETVNPLAFKIEDNFDISKGVKLNRGGVRC